MSKLLLIYPFCLMIYPSYWSRVIVAVSSLAMVGGEFLRLLSMSWEYRKMMRFLSTKTFILSSWNRRDTFFSIYSSPWVYFYFFIQGDVPFWDPIAQKSIIWWPHRFPRHVRCRVRAAARIVFHQPCWRSTCFWTRSNCFQKPIF